MKPIRQRKTAAQSRNAGARRRGVRSLRRMAVSLLALAVVLFTMAPSAFADSAYTYTVRLYAGNQGALTGNGVQVSSAAAKISKSKNQVTIRGLQYGDIVYITPQSAGKVTDDTYYVKGVRRSGRDNAEATESSFIVASDRDYVMAYGVSGDMVAYTVRYVDETGTQLLESDTYYGNLGERQYVSARYVDGYQPQSLNLVKTLSANEADNVFTFEYAPTAVPTPAPPEEGGETPAVTTPTTPAAPAAGGGAAAAGGAATAGAGAAAAPAAAAPAAAAPGGAATTALPDGNTPAGLTDLDDENTPLANQDLERPGSKRGYLPLYAGIGAAAAAALAAAAAFLIWKRRKKAAAAGAAGGEAALNAEESSLGESGSDSEPKA